jgi:NADH-quinone oxidoreductase subunit F
MIQSATGDATVLRIAAADPNERLLASVDDVACATAAVGSTGVPAVEPLVTVTRGGRTAFHARCTPDRIEELGARLPDSFDAVAGSADAVVEHDPDATRLPRPDLPGLRVGVRSVLGACGWRRPAHPGDHEAAGGFADHDPAAVLRVGARLRGRGWADWCQDDPVAATWEGVRGSDAAGTVVVNAHGNPADALLLASAPFDVLEGASAVARAVGADRVVVYASTEDGRAVETVRETVEAYPDPPAPFDVVIGPADYRAAEPTMALEAIEGNHRLEARLRPPGPDAVGLHGRPTLVHTPRTVAHLAVALRTGRAPDTRVVTVTGDVAAPATVELPGTEPVASALDAVDVDGEFKAACVGGRFGGVTADPDVAVDPEALADADLGTEGTVQVLADDRCVVEFVGRRARFASEENCGRCVPCREGATQLASLLREVYDGRYDPGRIAELVRAMTASSVCAFGVRAGRPARTAMSAFDSEFEAHADGRCPAGSCIGSLEVS